MCFRDNFAGNIEVGFQFLRRRDSLESFSTQETLTVCSFEHFQQVTELLTEPCRKTAR